MDTIWNSIRRNPIQIVAILVVMAMVGQNLLDGEPIEGTDWGMYFINLAMSFAAREFTVPLREHEEVIDDLQRQATEGGDKS